MTIMRPEDHRRIESVLEGWPVGITSYRLGTRWICHVDNVSPGAVIARGQGDSRVEAERTALEQAGGRLRSTRRMKEAVQNLHESVARLDSQISSKGTPED